jgi:hypothetical protein
MGRVPVLGTVSRAYGFFLGEFGTIFRLVWAPLIIGSGLTYFYGGQAIDAAIAAGVNADPARAMEYAPVQFLIGVVSFVTGIMALVALLQVVIFGDRKPGLFVYLWLGGAELRLILVSVLLFVAALAGAFALMLVLAVLAALAVAIPVMGVVISIGMIVLFIVLIWAVLRLSLVGPVVVAENNLGVERSWLITHGNALRIFAVLILAFVPYLLIATFAFFAVLGADMPAFPSRLDLIPTDAAKDGAAAKAAMEAFAKVMEAWQLDFMKAIRLHWLEIAVLGFAGNLVTTALWAGALGSAYRSIAGERAE